MKPRFVAPLPKAERAIIAFFSGKVSTYEVSSYRYSSIASNEVPSGAVTFILNCSYPPKVPAQRNLASNQKNDNQRYTHHHKC
jgi:hypothetical protein